MLTVGAPDPTFGSNGVSTLDGYTGGGAVAVEASGKLLVTTDSGVVQLNTDGSVDSAFGGAGLAGTTFTPVDVKIAPSGKIDVVGTVLNRFAVAQFNADGTPDTSFGTAGVATVRDVLHHPLTAGDLIVQSDNKIVVGGAEINPYAANNASNTPTTARTKVVFIRLSATGTVDTTYGTGGVSDVGDGFTYPIHMGLESTGTIVSTLQFSQTSGQPFSEIVEVDSTGTDVEPLVDDFTGTYSSLTVGSTGRIAVVGTSVSGTKPTTLQVYANGDFDPTFNSTGTVTLSAGDRVTVEPNGTFLIISDNSDATSQPFGQVTLHRLLATGLTDTAFGTGGVLAPALGEFHVTGQAVPLSTGDIFIPGSDARASDDSTTEVAKVQIAAGSAVTHPTVSGVTFGTPTVGGKYAYATVTFADTAANIDSSSVGSTMSVSVRTGASASVTSRVITANLVSTSGGDGDPLSATYVFRIDAAGLSRADSGSYQFNVPAGLVSDSNFRGSVGTVAGTYTLYIPAGRNRDAVIAPVATTITVL